MTLFWGCDFPSINLLVVRLLKKLLCPKTLLESVAQLQSHPGHEGCQEGSMGDSNCRCLPLQYQAACAASSDRACSDKVRVREQREVKAAEGRPHLALHPALFLSQASPAARHECSALAHVARGQRRRANITGRPALLGRSRAHAGAGQVLYLRSGVA